MCSTDIQKSAFVFTFFFFFQRELNVLPVICLMYCPLSVAKTLQGAKLEVAPWQVASSKMYTDHSTSHEV